MDTLQITKENAVKAHRAGCADVKKVLENLFGAEPFKQQKITDRVKSFEDACNVLCYFPEVIISEFDSKSTIAYKKLVTIIEALNEGWKPNWKDKNEPKYYPWWNMSGSGFSLYFVGCSCASSIVGSRLCFRSRELAEYAAKQFIDIYADYLT